MTIREMMKWNRPSNVPVSHRGQFSGPTAPLQHEISQMFDDFLFSNFSELYGPTLHSVLLAVDLEENNENFIIKVELPGIDTNDVEISVTDGFLTIKGEKKEDKEEEEDKNFLRREISYGSFVRTIALPEAADTEKAGATFKNGILTVEVPKKTEALQNPRRLQIKEAA